MMGGERKVLVLAGGLAPVGRLVVLMLTMIDSSRQVGEGRINRRRNSIASDGATEVGADWRGEDVRRISSRRRRSCQQTMVTLGRS